jgi:hypothetical protein
MNRAFFIICGMIPMPLAELKITHQLNRLGRMEMQLLFRAVLLKAQVVVSATLKILSVASSLAS